MAAPRAIAVEELPAEALRRLVGDLLGEGARLREGNAALREEVARLKGPPGRPKVKPSGMERGRQHPGAIGCRARPRAPSGPPSA